MGSQANNLRPRPIRRITSLPEFPFISVLGNIGSGKTTIAGKLADALKVPSYQELDVVDKEKLTNFYNDMAKYAFELQFSLLASRVSQQLEIIHVGRGAVQDRSLEEDLVFVRALNAAGLISDSQKGIYICNLALWQTVIGRPHVYVYLKASPARCLERIRQRDREFERGITLEYLEGIEREYDKLIKTLGPVPVIVVPWDEYLSEDDVIALIERELSEFTHIRHVTLPTNQLVLPANQFIVQA